MPFSYLHIFSCQNGSGKLSGAILTGKDVQIGKGHGKVNHFYEPQGLIIK